MFSGHSGSPAIPTSSVQAAAFQFQLQGDHDRLQALIEESQRYEDYDFEAAGAAPLSAALPALATGQDPATTGRKRQKVLTELDQLHANTALRAFTEKTKLPQSVYDKVKAVVTQFAGNVRKMLASRERLKKMTSAEQQLFNHQAPPGVKPWSLRFVSEVHHEVMNNQDEQVRSVSLIRLWVLEVSPLNDLNTIGFLEVGMLIIPKIVSKTSPSVI